MGTREVDGYLVTPGASQDGRQIWPVLHLKPEKGGDMLHKRILEDREFRSLEDAHDAAAEELQYLRQITEDGELIFSR